MGVSDIRGTQAKGTDPEPPCPFINSCRFRWVTPDPRRQRWHAGVPPMLKHPYCYRASVTGRPSPSNIRSYPRLSLLVRSDAERSNRDDGGLVVIAEQSMTRLGIANVGRVVNKCDAPRELRVYLIARVHEDHIQQYMYTRMYIANPPSPLNPRLTSPFPCSVYFFLPP